MNRDKIVQSRNIVEDGMKKTTHIVITGKVQGVFFRACTKEKADSLGVTGWVRNLPDGRVEALLQGPKAIVDTMLTWCEKGPPMANVAKLLIIDEEGTEYFSNFSILKTPM